MIGHSLERMESRCCAILKYVSCVIHRPWTARTRPGRLCSTASNLRSRVYLVPMFQLHHGNQGGVHIWGDTLYDPLM